jgi:hypothetical protein
MVVGNITWIGIGLATLGVPNAYYERLWPGEP